MNKQFMAREEKKLPAKASEPKGKKAPVAKAEGESSFDALHSQIGNRAVQRLLAQRSSNAPAEVDDETASRIESARGSGQTLDEGVRTQMSNAMGVDFSNVRVHTSPESDQLNRKLGASAFTTGQDIFFSQGAYSPGSSSGQKLLAHELTHVVQQKSGAVQSGGRMTVNAPGDRFEQEADAVAQNVTSAMGTDSVQRQELEEEEIQTKRLQRQEMEEDEEIQMQELPEEEVQMQVAPEEEELPGES
jgi:hypothetical protein